jgi:hypothetical protein
MSHPRVLRCSAVGFAIGIGCHMASRLLRDYFVEYRYVRTTPDMSNSLKSGGVMRRPETRKGIALSRLSVRARSGSTNRFNDLAEVLTPNQNCEGLVSRLVPAIRFSSFQ